MPTPKLLFDNNLSPTFPAAVADLFPGSAHVADIGDLRHGVDDPALVAYARDNRFRRGRDDGQVPRVPRVQGRGRPDRAVPPRLPSRGRGLDTENERGSHSLPLRERAERPPMYSLFLELTRPAPSRSTRRASDTTGSTRRGRRGQVQQQRRQCVAIGLGGVPPSRRGRGERAGEPAGAASAPVEPLGGRGRAVAVEHGQHGPARLAPRQVVVQQEMRDPRGRS